MAESKRDYMKAIPMKREVQVNVHSLGVSIYLGGKTSGGKNGGYAVVELSWGMLDRIMRVRKKEEAKGG